MWRALSRCRAEERTSPEKSAVCERWSSLSALGGMSNSLVETVSRGLGTREGSTVTLGLREWRCGAVCAQRVELKSNSRGDNFALMGSSGRDAVAKCAAVAFENPSRLR